ncbi:MAG: polyketide synthase 5 [Mycobacterium sp.]|nr:polyketide synthase 5 [Mycobacterium sp.]
MGQAAIAIARAPGAEILATAGSEQRRQLLRDMGIDHVYDSRGLEFAEGLRRDTDGYGLDIVLTSVIGAAQRAGLELLALGGRFVEIGKRGIYGDTSHVRRLLIEAAWHHRKPYRPRQRLRQRREAATPAARARGHAANHRLHARWVRFDQRQKRPAVANAAIARELAGWYWSLAVLDG